MWVRARGIALAVVAISARTSWGSTYVTKTNTKTMTVDVSATTISDTVNVTNSSSVTTYNVTNKSGMNDFGGLQLTDATTKTSNGSASTMSLSAAPESLRTAASDELQSNNSKIPSPASEHIDSSVQRTLEQENTNNEHPINQSR